MKSNLLIFIFLAFVHQTCFASEAGYRENPCKDPLANPEFRSAQYDFEKSRLEISRIRALKKLLDLAQIPYFIERTGIPGFRKTTIWLEPTQETKSIYLYLPKETAIPASANLELPQQVDVKYFISNPPQGLSLLARFEPYINEAGVRSLGKYSLTTKELMHILHERMRNPSGSITLGNAPLEIPEKPKQEPLTYTGRRGCFRKQAKVSMADGTQKEISKIQPGDMVLAYSLKNKKAVPRKVLSTFEHSATELSTLQFQDGTQIETTSNHPFYSLDRSDYVEAEKLLEGEKVAVLKNDHLVEKKTLKLQKSTGRENVFNIEVAEDNNYFVDSTLVHNKLSMTSF